MNEPLNKYVILFGIFIVILVIIGVIVTSCKWNKDDFTSTKEDFSTGETVTVNYENSLKTDVRFLKIGAGAAIDKESMRTFLNPTIAGTDFAVVQNKDGQFIQISVPEFRATNGFIPPSFAFFPYGSGSDLYRVYNKNEDTNLEGSKICMKECADTNCAAVQTEVSQNCSAVGIETEEGLTDSCGSSSEASCTLYYNNVQEADDAYYKIYDKYNQLTNRADYLGEKYYAFEEIPRPSPTLGQLPSEATVKWCPPDIVRPDPDDKNSEFTAGNPYATIPGSPTCTCISDPISVCEDPNCCIYRDLLTTEGAKQKLPFYNLPTSILSGRYCRGEVYDSDRSLFTGKNKCCGWCPKSESLWDSITGLFSIDTEDSNYEFIDCSDYKRGCCGECPVLDGGSIGTQYVKCPDANYWYEAEEESFIPTSYWVPSDYYECVNPDNGGLYRLPGEPEFDTCYNNALPYIKQKDDERAAQELMQCCYFRTLGCIEQSTQPDCDNFNPDSVIRGCFGDPPILNIDSVGNQGIGACSDNNTIPQSGRCINDPPGTLCSTFPYSCDDPEAGELWVQVSL